MGNQRDLAIVAAAAATDVRDQGCHCAIGLVSRAVMW
jgi:hypothetical protein